VTYVATVGTEPSPVLISALHHLGIGAATAVLLLHSDTTTGYAEAIRRAITALCPGAPVNLGSVGQAPGDFSAVRTRIRELVKTLGDQEWWADYSGGTKVMSVLLVEEHLRQHCDSARWRCYLDDILGVICYDDGSRATVKLRADFNLDCLRRLHGYEPAEKSRERGLTDKQITDIATATSAALDNKTRPRLHKETDWWTVYQYLCANSEEDPDGRNIGQALELAVAAFFADPPPQVMPRPDEVVLNFESTYHWVGAPVELDVVLRYGHRVLAISCKNRGQYFEGMDRQQASGKLAAAGAEIQQKARAVLGGAVRPILWIRGQQAAKAAAPLAELLLGPGLQWRHPSVFTQDDLRNFLTGQPEYRKQLEERLRLHPPRGRSAQDSHPEVDPPEDLTRNRPPESTQPVHLVTALSGNVLAYAAAAQSLTLSAVTVLSTSETAGPDDGDRGPLIEQMRLDVLGAGPASKDVRLERLQVDSPDHGDTVARVQQLIEDNDNGVVLDITGGTKATSVAVYVAALNAAKTASVSVCYSDLEANKLRWWDGTHHDQPKRPAATYDALRKMQRRPLEHVLVRLADLGCSNPWLRLGAEGLTRICPDAQVVVFSHDLLLLPEHLMVFTGTRVVGLYTNRKLNTNSNGGGLNEALFVDALVYALAGDAARTLLITEQESPKKLRSRYASLVRRRYQPGVLTPADLAPGVAGTNLLTELRDL
jgi:hypothetical protein